MVIGDTIPSQGLPWLIIFCSVVVLWILYKIMNSASNNSSSDDGGPIDEFGKELRAVRQREGAETRIRDQAQAAAFSEQGESYRKGKYYYQLSGIESMVSRLSAHIGWNLSCKQAISLRKERDPIPHIGYTINIGDQDSGMIVHFEDDGTIIFGSTWGKGISLQEWRNDKNILERELLALYRAYEDNPGRSDYGNG